MGIISAERVLNLIENSDSVEIGGTFISTNIKGNIEFQNVCKSYEKEPINSWILEDISFKISAGETIAIVGETGSGKTSVVNLINRFYEATKGEITLDDIPIKSYNLNELRKNIGMVVQDVFLFSDSIMNNIRLLDNSITEEKVITASKEIGAHDFIMNLPNGYYFNVMERGSLLSMGQRQLIAFIRAYVYDPKILILDEATSSVDSETERLISNATEKIIENRTSIIIAHRLSTIQKADRIIVFEKGKIKESGTHEELLDLNGKYKKLYNLQFASVN